MSFRMKKFEPVSSFKNSTEKQRDPYQLWRAKIAQQESEKTTQHKKSFRDIFISTVETNQSSKKEDT